MPLKQTRQAFWFVGLADGPFLKMRGVPLPPGVTCRGKTFTLKPIMREWLAGLILLAGVADDLRSRKIHNKLIMVLWTLALAFVALSPTLPLSPPGDILTGPAGLLPAFGRALLALIFTVPLVFLKVMGGGDMKLFVVLSLLLSFGNMFWVLVLSLGWAALLGLIKAVLDKKSLLLAFNIWNLLKWQQVSSDELNTFPFSVGLLLAYLTVISQEAFF